VNVGVAVGLGLEVAVGLELAVGLVLAVGLEVAVADPAIVGVKEAVEVAVAVSVAWTSGVIVAVVVGVASTSGVPLITMGKNRRLSAGSAPCIGLSGKKIAPMLIKSVRSKAISRQYGGKICGFIISFLFLCDQSWIIGEDFHKRINSQKDCLKR
jgi:hypothetical protein